MKDASSEAFDFEDMCAWRSLLPGKAITDKPFAQHLAPLQLSDIRKKQLLTQVTSEGFFCLPQVLESETVSGLRNMIQTLNANQIMPIFAAVYDEFWTTLYKIRDLLSPILGPGYRLVPDFWIWHIPTGNKSAGWAPHRDGGFNPDNMRRDGTPTLCTAWIALTDVSPDNACMYALSKRGDPLYQDFLRRYSGRQGIANAGTLPIDLSYVRALPASAGSVIGWEVSVMHWGGRSSAWAEEPRISIGVYYQAAQRSLVGRAFDNSGTKFIDYENPGCRLSMTDRLTIIANNIETYRYKLDTGEVHEEHYNPGVSSFARKWSRNRE